MIAVYSEAGSPREDAAAKDVPPPPRMMRMVFLVALAVSLLSLPGTAFADETTGLADRRDDAIVFGLTATQLAVAAAVGAAAGATGALVSGNVIAGASLGFGTLAAIYVAHLAAEAVVVGGVYYWWPWETKPEGPVSRTMAIRGGDTGPKALPSLQHSQ